MIVVSWEGCNGSVSRMLLCRVGCRARRGCLAWTDWAAPDWMRPGLTGGRTRSSGDVLLQDQDGRDIYIRVGEMDNSARQISSPYSPGFACQLHIGIPMPKKVRHSPPPPPPPAPHPQMGREE